MVRNTNGGQIALPFVLLVGGIIVEIVIAGSLVSFFINATSLGEKLSIRALAAANTGIYDAVMKISANKEYAASPVNYNITINDDVVSVNVSRTASPTIYLYTVDAVATAKNRKRRVVAKVVVDQTSGRINLNSIEEESVQ